ncbi:uncharacterized protein LOC141900382 [Tubulanus polymorphus]|uniref:uncharacterized protein LOC141900382 n=1 Tax=Tubulanus polymorphus TaxID=672921 RepID=UPI003DA5B58D
MNSAMLTSKQTASSGQEGTPKSMILPKKEQSLTVGKNRKTLQTIQPTATRSESAHKPHVKLNINPLTPKRVNVYQDPKKKAKQQESQQDADLAEAHELMVQETIPETYWKEIAEQRRAALAEALQENEKLHKSIEKLEIENSELKEMADQAEYYAGIIKTLLEEQNDSGLGSDLHVTQEEIENAPDNDSKEESDD